MKRQRALVKFQNERKQQVWNMIFPHKARENHYVFMCGLEFILLKSLKLVEVQLINVMIDCSDFVTFT